jgi:hypothetical protein
VVVQAPTGSGKTYIFGLLYPNLKTQEVFTVPTRAVTTGSGFEPRLRRVNALHPNLARSPIMHHKRAYDQFANDTPATTARRTDAFKSMASVSIHRKPLTMNQNLLSEL